MSGRARKLWFARFGSGALLFLGTVASASAMRIGYDNLRLHFWHLSSEEADKAREAMKEVERATIAFGYRFGLPARQVDELVALGLLESAH